MAAAAPSRPLTAQQGVVPPHPRLLGKAQKANSEEITTELSRNPTDNPKLCVVQQAPSTTVVDRRQVEAIRVFGSDSGEHGIDASFSIVTSGEDAQCRAILAKADASADDAVRER
jgi:hypothetical protein